MTYLNKMILRNSNKVPYLVIQFFGGGLQPIYFI